MSFTDAELTKDRFLGGKLHILQPKTGYRAATDPVFLAAACPAKQGDSVLDLGSGAGTAGLCLAARVPVSVTGLEIQPEYAELARRNAAQNQIELEILDGDLAQMPDALKARTFDHVIMNPPFFGSGATPADHGRAVARQAQTDLRHWIDAGLRRLRQRGWITIIHLTDRLPDIIASLHNRAGGIEIKPLSPREHKPATRVILRARKGSKSKAVLCNPLILHEGASHSGDADSYTTAARAILRDGASIEF